MRSVLITVFVLLATCLAVTDTAAARPKTVTVTMTPSARVITLGDRAVLTGQVHPARVGDKVVLQMRYDKSTPWTTIRKARITKGKRYRVTTVPDSATSRYYRVTMPGTTKRKAGHSPATRITVRSWRYLTDMTSLSTLPSWQVGIDRGNPVDINGVTFIKSMVNWSNSYDTTDIEYNLSRKCEQLVATYGLSDESGTGSRATIEVSSRDRCQRTTPRVVGDR